MDPSPEQPERPMVTLARGGAGHRVAADTLEAFTLALRLGVTGLETPIHALSDGTVVLRGRGRLGPMLRRRSLSSLTVDQLPDGVVTLDALLDTVETPPHLVFHVTDQAAFEAVNVALEHRDDLDPTRLWLASGDRDRLVEWRPRTTAGLLLILAPRKLTRGVERLASDLRTAEIDGLGLHHPDWTAGHVATLRRFGRLTLGWGAEYERELAVQFRLGLDVVSSEYPDRLAAVAGGYAGEEDPARGTTAQPGSLDQ